MKIEQDIKLDFDDVLIKPKRSDIPSRDPKFINLKRQYRFKYSPIELNLTGIVAANMDTTGTFAMAKSMFGLGCMTALHKFYSKEQLEKFLYSDDTELHSTFISTGVRQTDKEKLFSLPKKIVTKTSIPPLICIDVPNAYYSGVVNYCAEVRKQFPMSVIMAGNVCTPEMAQELVINGKVDIVKVGVGPGSVCTTRYMTGVGYPQFSAVAECADVVHGLKAHICCDGGCKEPGDVNKAFGAGADFVMLGGMLAGTEECDGEWEYDTNRIVTVDVVLDRRSVDSGEYLKLGDPIKLVLNGQTNTYVVTYRQYKKKTLKFYGMSSKEAQDKYYGGVADYKAAEGECIEVPYKGEVKDVMQEVLGGIRSCCTYIGCDCLKDIPKCTTFVRVNRIK